MTGAHVSIRSPAEFLLGLEQAGLISTNEMH
jgi:hypothetical protein